MQPRARRDMLSRLAPILSDVCVNVDADLSFGVRCGPDDVIDLATRPTPAGVRLYDSVAGFTAPADWDAFGVVGLGTARTLSGQAPLPERLVVAHLADRHGWAMTTTGPPGGPYETVGPAAGGLLADACLRVLGLPTAPTSRSPLEFFARCWLTSLRDTGCSRQWSAVAAAFPGGGPRAHAGGGPIELVDHGRLMALSHGWGALRRACAEGELVEVDLPPQLAGWMDDAMFARWVCDGPGPFDVLVTEALAHLAVSVARKVAWVLRAWGLEPGAQET